MNENQKKAILELRMQGYAVVVFNPDELDGASSERVEELLIERGWNAIDDLREPEE